MATPQAKAVVTAFFEKDTSTAQYVVFCPKTKRAAIIDSVLDYDQPSGTTSTKSADALIGFVEKENLVVEWILETHAHADHLTAAPYLKERLASKATTPKIGIGKSIVSVQEGFKKIFNFGDWLQTDGSQWDVLFGEGDRFSIGDIRVEILQTPGHTPACVCYHLPGDAIFVGDTMFMPDQGTARCDFPLGSAEQLWDSIQRILSLPEDTRLFTCHDYQPGGREVKYETTVGEQRRANVNVKEGTTREQFIEWRKGRDANLAQPRLIIPSIQVNINAGRMPPAESNGTTYLKVPINILKK